MAASAKPRGAVPEKHGKSMDVNESTVTEVSSESVTDEAASLQENMPTDQGQEQEASLSEEDVQEWMSERKVPYNRFKEVNEERQTLRKELDELRSSFEAKLDKEVGNAEARLAAQLQKANQGNTEESLNYFDSSAEESPQLSALNQEIEALKGELTHIKGETNEAKLRRQMDELQTTYPRADRTAVLGWKKVTPRAELEDLMAKSHNDNEAMVQNALKEILDNKKAKAKQAIPMRSTRPLLKPEERPKTIRDAHKRLKALRDGFFNSER